MKLTLSSKPYRLTLKYPFTISRLTRTHQDTVVVSITDGMHIGLGEAIPYAYYNITNEKIESSINKSRAIVENGFGLHPDELWQQLEDILQDDYFTLCAINCAYWDYYARAHNRIARSYFCDTQNNTTPLSNYTIGIDSIDIMAKKIKETPWPIYKIKLGTEHDVEIVSELRKITKAIFRIDANCAWTVDETLKNAVALKDLGVEFIEQPLKADDWEGMKILKKKSVLPIIADESCQRLADVEKCVEFFHGINIKLMKCGGITPALKMITLAREKNSKVMAGCMAESTVGISSLAQIAPLLDYIDADGAMLLKNNIAIGATLENGKILFPEQLGSGAVLLP